MRAVLLTLLMLFCLPLQWAGAAEREPCVHEPCASVHANLADTSGQAETDDHVGESHAQQQCWQQQPRPQSPRWTARGCACAC